jgi:putative transposase
MSKAQLHFIDTLILRYYAGKRTLRLSPYTLYKLAGSTLERTGNLWLDPDKCPGEGAEHVVEELLDPRLPMLVILTNEEKARWLTKISRPSQSWFYGYLRWFEAQPDQGRKVIVSRYGQEMWEREYMVFDTFASRAVRSLEYVFADHWLVDVFIVDEATRSRLDRLWLTLLLDAYSRSVLGLSLLYEVPCIESIQSALQHAIWPKVSHQKLDLKGEWVCYGIPQQLSLDNAWAHHAHSLEQLSRDISQGGKYNSIDLVFRPPYRGRYGALIERLFGNFSGQMKELLPGAIQSSAHRDVENAARQACLLYQDIYTIIHHMIIRYQHTPHRELDGLTPHEKWVEGWQLGYGGWPPPLTDDIERLFWRREPESRFITSKGISAFGMHYWSPILDQAKRKGFDGKSVAYHFSYEPADISRLALFRDGQWLGDVYAKQLRRADGSTRSISLWERKMAQALARERGQAGGSWLALITELDELSQTRTVERKQAQRQAKAQVNQSRASGVQAPSEPRLMIGDEPDYTELLFNFVSEPAEMTDESH